MDCISTRAKVAGCLLVVVLVHVVQQVDDAVAVAVLVVIPADTHLIFYNTFYTCTTYTGQFIIFHSHYMLLSQSSDAEHAASLRVMDNFVTCL